MTIDYTEFKRDIVSPCNICKRVTRLTWDHIPPQACASLGSVELENIFKRYISKPEERKYRISQTGVRFRSICSNCNNFELGKKLDPALIDFSNQVGSILKSSLIIPDVFEIDIRPSALIRSFLGHILAAKTHIDEVPIDQDIRNFIFDYDKGIPDNIHVFYWIFPYNNVIVFRDFAMPAIRGKFENVGLFSLLKFFPIAYLVTDQPKYEGLTELTKYRDLKLNEVIKVRIDLKTVKNRDWPENIEPGNYVTGGLSFHSAVFAKPHKK